MTRCIGGDNNNVYYVLFYCKWMRQLYLCKNLYYYDYYPLLVLAKTFYVFPTLVYFEKYLSSFAERFMAFLPIDTTKSNPIKIRFKWKQIKICRIERIPL